LVLPEETGVYARFNTSTVTKRLSVV
jgi:hypothetical protein